MSEQTNLGIQPIQLTQDQLSQLIHHLSTTPNTSASTAHYTEFERTINALRLDSLPVLDQSNHTTWVHSVRKNAAICASD